MWLRLRQIALIANELDPIIAQMRELLGLEVGFRDPAVKTFGLQNAIFPVGNQFIEVVSPVQPNTAGGRYLERRKGDGGYMVILQCDQHAPRKHRVAELKVRKVLESDDLEYSIMQLHPRDTGGSFLEVDFQKGGEDINGPWHPAGRNWKAAVRTDIVRAIAAVELQSDNPDGLAFRWSEILELPLHRDAGRPAQIKLENAIIRFVKQTDGRGEGLGGIDLVAVKRDRALQAALRQGRRISDDTLVIGGTRMKLV